MFVDSCHKNKVVFVAGVNKHVKQCYKEYCENVEKPPKLVMRWVQECRVKQPAAYSETFYGAVFSTVACAEFGSSKCHFEDTDFFYSIHRIACADSLSRLEIFKLWNGLSTIGGFGIRRTIVSLRLKRDI
jgi:hypothetical protein